MIELNFEESDYSYLHAIQSDPLDVTYFLRDEEIQLESSVSTLSLVESVFGNSLMYDEKKPISEYSQELLSSFQSIGIESTLFYSDESNSVPFCRQHRYMMELGDLVFHGAEVKSVFFPSVGFEIVTRKYMRNFGIYTPDFGIISSNRISHIIYGIAEYPLGNEAIVFSVTTCRGTRRYWWGPDGIKYLYDGPPVCAYYIQQQDGQYVQVSGSFVEDIKCLEIKWYHMCLLLPDRDYIVNIDGVNHLLMGIRKMIISVEDNLTRAGNVFKSVDAQDGRYFYDLDNKVIMCPTTRSPETYATYEHIMRDAMVVREFLMFTKLLNKEIVASKYLLNVKIVPAGSTVVEHDNKGVVVFFDRLSSKSGTSRNYNVFQRIRRLGFAMLDDVFSMNVSFIGNNRNFHNVKKYYCRVTLGHVLYPYIGLIRHCRTNVDEQYDCYDTQLGKFFLLRVSEPLQAAQLSGNDMTFQVISENLQRIKGSTEDRAVRIAIESMAGIVSSLAAMSSNKRDYSVPDLVEGSGDK